MRKTWWTAAGAALWLLPRLAQANDRHFTYTYESGVLAPGEREVEPWMTFRGGRDDFFARFDHRLELEMGLMPHVQTALYFNLTASAAKGKDGFESGMDFKGVSSEWKLQLMDPVADGLGLALYFETTASPTELELESKLILDKRFRHAVVAFNAVVEREIGFDGEEAEHETKLELVGGVSFLVTPRFSFGAEVRQQTVLVDHEGWEGTTLWAGPVVAMSIPHGWVSASLMPQLVSVHAPPLAVGWDLEHNERVQARLLIGWHL